MRRLLTLLLGVAVGLGPAMPQYALAEPPPLHDVSKAEEDKDFEVENSFEVLDLGTEERPLKVLFIHVRERETVKRTMKDVKDHLHQAANEHPNLRFLSITVHPKIIHQAEDEDGNLNRLTEPVSYVYWRQDSGERVAEALDIGSLHNPVSRHHVESNFNKVAISPTVKSIIDHSRENNPDHDDAPMFLQALSQNDINELRFTRPRTDLVTGGIRAVATGLGVALAVQAGSGGDATALQTLGASALPSGLALWSGIKNQMLADFEETSHFKGLIEKFKFAKQKNKERAAHYLKEVEGIVKNIGLAFTYVAALQLSMVAADLVQEPVTWGTFTSGVLIGTARNVYKKTFMIRALHKWTHRKYRTDPKNAAYYAKVNAWMMAMVGAVITGTDSLQFLPNSYEWAHTSSYIIDSALFLGGAAAFFAGGKIKRAYDWSKNKCSNLFTNKSKK